MTQDAFAQLVLVRPTQSNAQKRAERVVDQRLHARQGSECSQLVCPEGPAALFVEIALCAENNDRSSRSRAIRSRLPGTASGSQRKGYGSGRAASRIVGQQRLPVLCDELALRLRLKIASNFFECLHTVTNKNHDSGRVSCTKFAIAKNKRDIESMLHHIARPNLP
jgi:hypothetical protein